MQMNKLNLIQSMKQFNQQKVQKKDRKVLENKIKIKMNKKMKQNEKLL